MAMAMAAMRLPLLVVLLLLGVVSLVVAVAAIEVEIDAFDGDGDEGAIRVAAPPKAKEVYKGNYMGFPRLNFAGEFVADVATTNNDALHYDPATFRTSYQKRNASDQMNGSWNPPGSNGFRIQGCSVRSVTYTPGARPETNVANDAIIGTNVIGNNRADAKLVNLDVYLQDVADLWGLSILIGSVETGQFGGPMTAVAERDRQLRVVGGFDQTPSYSSFWQSVVLKAKRKPGTVSSPFLDQLFPNDDERRLSIKLIADGFSKDILTQRYTRGRLIGTIGPAEDLNAPISFVPGRILESTGKFDCVTTDPTNPVKKGCNAARAYALVTGNVLTFDLGNSLPTRFYFGAPFADFGPIYVGWYFVQDGEKKLHIDREIRYRDPEWYETTAGVVSTELKASKLKQIAQTQLHVFREDIDPATKARTYVPILSEPADGTLVLAENPTVRIPAETAVDVRLWALQWGVPVPANTAISFALDDAHLGSEERQGDIGSGPPCCVPLDGVKFDITQYTKTSDGRLNFIITAGALTKEQGRKWMDSQVYSWRFRLGAKAPSPFTDSDDVGGDPQQIYALVWTKYIIPQKPNWVTHILPLLKPFANLYPVMKPFVDLGSYRSVLKRRGMMVSSMNLSLEDPNYMPATRELSPERQQTIINWLRMGEPWNKTQNPNVDPNTLWNPSTTDVINPPFMTFDTREDLCNALNYAIQLEHATIPPYLTAAWSMKPGANGEVMKLINEVAMDEMTHMGLVSNILVSISQPKNETDQACKVKIGRDGFMPLYPGPLPAGISDLVLRLRKASVTQVRDIFVSIEEPMHVSEERRGAVHPGGTTEEHLDTIGAFYAMLKGALRKLGEQNPPAITFGNLDNQVVAKRNLEITKISSLNDAIAAIDLIVSEGEGTNDLSPFMSQQPFTKKSHDLAHYFKFQEIVHGRRIVAQSRPTLMATTLGRLECYYGRLRKPNIADPDVTSTTFTEEFTDADKKQFGLVYLINPDTGRWNGTVRCPMGFEYSGAPIPFDESVQSVWPMVDDPDMDSLDHGSRARTLSEQFARKYQLMLQALDRTFNGETELFQAAIAGMFSLEVLGRQLMQEPTGRGDGTTCGPAFQLPYPILSVVVDAHPYPELVNAAKPVGTPVISAAA